MINFKNLYNQQDLLSYFNEYFPDFEPKKEELELNKKFKYIKSVVKLGKSKKLDVNVYEIDHVSENDPRVTLSKEAFSILREYIARKSLVIFKNSSTQNYRLSLITFQSTWESGNKIKTEFSNPRRYSFFLGPDAKVKTPTRFLIEKGKIIDFEDLKKRFSLEVVNKEFYRDISEQFIKLVGGSLSKGKKKIEYQPLLKLPTNSDKSQATIEFAVRLIGRVIFCWFLREKKSLNRKSLMPKDLLSYEAIGENADYYHKILEPIFFEVLNKSVRQRREDFVNDLFSSVPYLNGGLFSPHEDDFYKRNNGDYQSRFHNTLIIPDLWFAEFFEVLETYNFTIDENTSFDEELSIDPEMLGRIFENLLAEINPETGESARKSTGSYYTPRVIVDYMVDESLFLYLQNQTKIEEKKLRATISYDLNDDLENPITDDEKQKMVDALEKVKILDPACGSGAFPIGALQKIVFILQQIDPLGKLWIKKQLVKADPEFRKDIEKRFSNNELDFIRKLGVIRNSIYGVDIQPIATEISRLRCFLTLIVDEIIKDDDENRGIKPLPNLDFKFVTANSLIGLPKTDDSPQQLLFDERKNIEKLRELMDEFFSTDEQGKYMLMNSFNRIQKDLIKQYFSEKDYSMYEQKKILSDLGDWDPFAHKATTWFDPEWMFGVKEGFDIVIANPPYLGEKNHKYIFDDVKKGNLKEFYNGQMDLFYFFFHLSINLNKDYGTTTLITTNYYSTARGAKKLRTDFKLRTTIKKMINFNELKIFESAKGQHNMITIVTKHSNNNSMAENCVTKNQGVATNDKLHNILTGIDKKTNYYSVKQKDLYDGQDFYIRIAGCGKESSSPINNILYKLENNSDKLINLCNVNVGLYTGADKVSENYLNKYHINVKKNEGIYIINKKELEKLNLNEYELSKIEPFYKNSNIHKWVTDINPSLFLINLSYPENKDIDFHKIPNIAEHLSKFESILKGRKSNDNGLRAVIKAGYWQFFTIRQINFSQPKIVVPQRSSSNNFGYNEKPWYTSADVYFITKKDDIISLKYVLALLNSKLYYLWLYHRGKRKGETLELYQKPLSEIPIKKILQTEQKPLTDITNKILIMTNSDDYLANPEKQIQVKEYEKQIDQMVYKLYGLTQEEIQIVEETSNG